MRDRLELLGSQTGEVLDRRADVPGAAGAVDDAGHVAGVHGRYSLEAFSHLKAVADVPLS
jgi:hypothetical protein